MKLGDVTRLALKNIWRRKLRSTLTIMGIAVAVGVAYLLLNGTEVVKTQIKSAAEDSANVNNVIVYPQASTDYSQNDPSKVISDQTLTDLSNIPGVSDAFPMIFAERSSNTDYIIHSSDGNDYNQFDIASATPLDEPDLKRLYNLKSLLADGQFLSSPSDSGVILTDDIAKQTGLQVGQTATVSLYKFDLNEDGTQKTETKKLVDSYQLKVFGIINPSKQTLDPALNSIVYSDIATSKKIKQSIMAIDRSYNGSAASTSTTLYDAAKVRVADVTTMDQILQAIKAKGFATTSLNDSIATINTTFTLIEAIMLAISLIGILIAVFNISNTMYMTVIERRHEIGILKALGETNSHIRRMFLIEAMMFGVLGAILGILIASILGIALISIGNNAIATNAAVGARLTSLGISGSFQLSYQTSFLVLLASVVGSSIVATIAGYLPALQADHLDPSELLRYE